MLQSAAGTLVGLSRGDIAEISMLGAEIRRINVRGEDLHHEVFPLPDGTFLAPRSAPLLEPAFPVSALDPDGPTAPTRIQDHELLRIGPRARSVVGPPLGSSWTPPGSRGSRSHPTATGRRDWAHVNGLIGASDGGMLVSVRHQDALLKLDVADSLEWILGDPGGWDPPWSEKLLRRSARSTGRTTRTRRC